MKYSVIIPVYNSHATLGRCFDSFVNGKFGDYEILLVNDGSTDGSDKICREYADKYQQIRYFSKENGGVSSARNLGLEMAQGEYILFADSDDYVADDYFERIEDVLSVKKSDMLLFGAQSFGGQFRMWNTGDYAEAEENAIAKRISIALRGYLFSSLWSKAFKRSIIENNRLRFDERLHIGEDQAFIFAYAMYIDSIVSISDTLYHVDVSSEGSLSRKRRDYLTEQLIEVNRRMVDALKTTVHSPQARKEYAAALSYVSYRSAYSCCKELLKYNYSTKQRRAKIREICKLYRAENIKPLGLKCKLIAFPIKFGLSGVIDFLINYKSKG